MAPVWWLVALAAVLAVLCLGVLAAQLAMARNHLARGLQDWRLAVAETGNIARLRQPAVRITLHRNLAAAQREFAAARVDLRLWSPVMVHLGVLPLVGGQLAAGPAAADASFYTTRAALHMLDGLVFLWKLPASRTGSPTLPTVATSLLAVRGQFVAAHRDADRALRALARLPLRTGNADLDLARDRLRKDLPLLRSASTWLELAPAIFGATRPARYLIVLEDQMELRATGGFIAAADFLSLDRGSISSHFTDSALPHEIRSVLVPLPEALYTPETRWTFRDSNWSPDFPLSARLERWFYGEDTGRWADGVINLTDNGVLDILRATGPVYLPAYRRWVDAHNVLALVQHYVNGPYKGPIRGGVSNTTRKQFLGTVINALLLKIQATPPDRWLPLGQALLQAAGQGDELVYDRRPVVESAVRAVHADGSIRRPPGDYLYVVDDNRSYNKINPYVRESARYHVAILPNRWLESSLTIRYHVAPSPPNLEGFGPGYGSWGSKHDYQDFLRVYAPPGSMLLGSSGWQRWAPTAAYGMMQFAGRVLVREGQSRTVTIRYRVPPTVLGSNPAHYHITVQHQPGANLTRLRLVVRGLHGVKLTGRLGSPVSAVGTTLRLGRNASLDLPLRGLTRPPTLRGPSHSSSSDPYIPFAYLHDPRHRL